MVLEIEIHRLVSGEATSAWYACLFSYQLLLLEEASLQRGPGVLDWHLWGPPPQMPSGMLPSLAGRQALHWRLSSCEGLEALSP